ncbi:MAG TPA: ABC transporter substrate-binding protein [Anaerohalosphaeraceae bacterium]|nr:ABC transporter substrate-binding protein [Anaerohalosphaeraceae bacterium]HQG06678.1 ABC transporter substrate-binding protein [Anaerohalosphaeraceae bacterium]HQI08251.1 ABC transporter substrate-binding protein [Anaerohalosphaeraceae bacterium]HQJ68570.1 ABC transporter substrate-binding protein [Anaerohalosphaeraceae bacterium]
MKKKTNSSIVVYAALPAAIAAAVFVGCRKSSTPPQTDRMLIRLPLFTKIQTLDSGNLTDIYSLGIASQIFESLYEYHYLKRPCELVPLLAEEMPQISDDYLTYTIRIKKGIFFQDDPCFPDGKGREVTAADFVYALKRIANVKYMSQRWPDWNGRIVGLDEFREFTKGFQRELDVDYSRPVEGLQALDDYTLQFKLTKPWPQLAWYLASAVTAPAAREAAEYYGRDIMYHPVGTGPFRLKIWQRSFYIELVRNETWHGGFYPAEGEPSDAENGYLADAGKPLPFADAILYRIIEEFQPAWLMFLRGDLDMMQIFKDNFSQAVNPDTLTAAPEMSERGIRLLVFDDPSVFWVGFNMQDAVLGPNKPLRKAICRAIDRQAANRLFFNGVHKIAYGYLPPGLEEYDPNIVHTDYARYDPAEARALIQEAQALFGGPIPPLTIAIPGTSNLDRQIGQFLQKYFADVGLQLRVDYMDWPTYLDGLNKGKLQIFFSGASPSIPDSLDMLMAFCSWNWGYGGNHFYYSNPQFDDLYRQVEGMFPGPERTRLCRRMERIMLDDYPAAFLNHRVSIAIIHDWYRNAKPHVFSYNTAKYRKIDLEQRSRYKKLLKELKKTQK